MDLRPGSDVFGETPERVLKVERILGAGGFGMVYLVRDPSGAKFALKTIASAFLNDLELDALVNEGRSAVGISHPNILSVMYLHDGVTYPGLPPYMLMEYADGGTLADLIRARRGPNDFFEVDELRGMMNQLASGMDALSRKLVHRDVKPDNILLKGGLLKIADFGLAKLVGAITRSKTFKGIGHIMYQSPEGWLQDKNALTMDIYSMGLVFYEMATLRHAYTVPDAGDIIDGWRSAHISMPVPDPRDLNPALGLATVQIIQKMTAKRAGDRYQSWPEVLARLSAGDPAPAAGRPNVGVLLEKALKTKAEQEALHLAAESKRREAAERLKLIEVAFRTIVDAARLWVEDFNAASDSVKLELVVHELTLRVRRKGVSTAHGEVYVGVHVAPKGHELGKVPIRAWGGARAPSGRGFNLFLIGPADDIYGEWWTLHNSHSPFARGSRDTRPSPFPFNVDELPQELMYLTAMHVYQSTKDAFRSDVFSPLLEELV